MESDIRKFLRGESTFFVCRIFKIYLTFVYFQALSIEFPTSVYSAEVLQLCVFLQAPWDVFTSSVKSRYTQGFIRP